MEEQVYINKEKSSLLFTKNNQISDNNCYILKDSNNNLHSKSKNGNNYTY